MIEKLKKEFRFSEFDLKPNFKTIPVNALYANHGSIELFNEVYLWAKNNIKRKIKRTPSGGVSYNRNSFKTPMWDVEVGGTWIGLTLLLDEGFWRIQMRFGAEKDGKKQYGAQSFSAFKKKLKSAGIDLDDYIIENGAEVKQEIEKPLIKLEHRGLQDLVFENVHHIDFHNSYPAGLVNTHPEFKDVITEMYEKRKTNETYKAILNHSIGYMQSIKCCDAKWAHLSRDAINDNNKRIRELAERLKAAGRFILAYNTDGIWYSGDVYHGEGEGKKLGEWENDHINCKWRAKSAGSYEFIENGTYKPVVRGRTLLDRMKPREFWKWGDIYDKNAEPLVFYWTEDKGVVKEEINENYNEIIDKSWFTL